MCCQIWPRIVLKKNCKHYIKYSTMTITTRTIAKGIPARLRKFKPEGKPPATKSNAKAKPTTKESRKRATRKDESEEESEPAKEKEMESDVVLSYQRPKGRWMLWKTLSRPRRMLKKWMMALVNGGHLTNKTLVLITYC